MRRTDQTLLEQMQISDVEIQQRMDLLCLDKDALRLLTDHKQAIEEQVDALVDEFYERQTSIDDISLLIGDADTLRRLRTAQRKYVIDLFSGQYDGEYVNNRLRIGLVHKRIGVEPKLYLSAVRHLKQIICHSLSSTIKRPDVLDATLDALDKLIDFDTTLVVDTYISSLVEEIETAKRRTEDYARSLEDKVAERTRQLEELTKIDPLTNIFNQRAMQDMLRHELAMAHRRQTRLALVYFDIDHFKEINDTQGHIKGDEVLRAVGQTLRNNVRDTDIPCRYGGDEFCLILPECNLQDAFGICDKIIGEFSDRFPDYSLSIGIAETGPSEHLDSDQLIKTADEKMYQAKQTSGFQICG